jgi:hypothetical protein
MRRERILKVILGCLGLVLVGIFVNLTQNGVAVGETQPPTVQPDELAKYTLVYLAQDEAIDSDSLLESAHLQMSLGARSVNTWEQVPLLNRITPIDAILIHNSALSGVDSNWLGPAYKSGVVVVIFNTYAPELASLIGDSCILENGWMDGTDPYPGEFYIMVSRLTLGQPEDIALIESQVPCGGGPNRGVTGVKYPAEIYLGKSQNALVNQEDFDRFATNLVDELKSIDEMKNDSLH